MALFTGISRLNKGEATALINAFALALSEGLNDDDLNALGNLITAIGSVMLTFAAAGVDPAPKDAPDKGAQKGGSDQKGEKAQNK